MAVLKTGGGASRKQPQTRGSHYIYTSKGQVVMAAWPTNKKPRNNPTNQYWREWFAEANMLAKYAAAKEQAAAKEITAGSPLYPRDIMIMCMRGRAWGILRSNGTKVYPVAAQQDVSRSLDIISQIPGSMMFRGESLWQYVPPGTDGQVLAYNEATATPEWVDPPSGGGGPSSTNLVGTTVQTLGYAAMGIHLTPLLATTIHNLWGRCAVQAGWTAHAEIWTSASGVLGALVATSDTKSYASATTVSVLFTFATPPTLTAGQEYSIIVVRTDGTGTTSLRWYYGTAAVQPLPINGPLGYELYNVNTLANGTTPSTFTNIGYMEHNLVFEI